MSLDSLARHNYARVIPEEETVHYPKENALQKGVSDGEATKVAELAAPKGIGFDLLPSNHTPTAHRISGR